MKHSLKIFFLILSLLLGASEATRHWWFSQDQTTEKDAPFLKWNPPENAIDRKFSETAGGQTLSHDDGMKILIEKTGNDLTAELIYLNYKSGNHAALNDLIFHTPENCFPASGARLVKELPLQMTSVSGQKLLIRQWIFESPLFSKKLHVFKVIWSPRFIFSESDFHQTSSATGVSPTMLRRIRLSAARQGLDSPAIRVILAVVTNTDNSSEAWKAFKKLTIDRLSQPVK